MARTTLSRRIRRIGRLPQEIDSNGVTHYPTIDFAPDVRAEEIAVLRRQAKDKRIARRKKAGK